MNSQQLLRDVNIGPTREIVADGLGLANAAYTGFVKEFEDHDVQLEWHYYNDGKAWLGKGLYKWSTIRGTQKEITVFWLSIWDDFFKVTIYIPEKNRQEALNLPLNDEIIKIIKESKPMGKLKFFPLIFDLRSDDLFSEVFTVIDFKKALK